MLETLYGNIDSESSELDDFSFPFPAWIPSVRVDPSLRRSQGYQKGLSS